MSNFFSRRNASVPTSEKTEPQLNKINISSRLLGDVAWLRILESTAFQLQSNKVNFFGKINGLESLRKNADYNTGSISAASAWLLYSAVYYFQPRNILEIGTFIGKSSLAMALGADDASASCEIHTCDLSNDIQIPIIATSKIVQYRKMSSTDMLRTISKDNPNIKFDFLHIDGRLQEKDYAFLRAHLHPWVVVALDDFEGVEKGVANLINIRNEQLFPDHRVAYPCSHEILSSYGLKDGSTTALLIPQSLIQFTNQ